MLAFHPPAQVQPASAPAVSSPGAASLRRALGEALAAGDAERFGDLKIRFDGQEPELVYAVQRLLALLGTSGPRLRFWRLPELEVESLLLRDLGGTRIWIGPMGARKGAAPPGGMMWVVPVGGRVPPAGKPPLDWVTREDGDWVAAQFRLVGRRGWMAVSRKEFEAQGLGACPMIIDLDDAGLVRRIRLVDPSDGP